VGGVYQRYVEETAGILAVIVYLGDEMVDVVECMHLFVGLE